MFQNLTTEELSILRAALARAYEKSRLVSREYFAIRARGAFLPHTEVWVRLTKAMNAQAQMRVENTAIRSEIFRITSDIDWSF